MSPSASTVLSPTGLTPATGSWPWRPELGPGRFRNPIIHADYSDPDVIRHGDDFYLTASSFNCTPGLPILHSRDLVHWQLISHAVRNLPHPRYERVQHGCGIWAPAMRFHAGRFWIFFPMPDEGIYVTTAARPEGRWSEPHLLQAGRGLIDPCPLWDDDGRAYLVHAYAGSRAGIKHRLRICPMAPDATRLLGEGQIVFHEPKRHPTVEGPKFLKRDGWYYLFAPAGGVATGWQIALRSRHIFGPYEDRVVLAQGGTAINGPHQGALVDTPNGEWWFIHFQDAGVYGRLVHLQPVRWQDGWPVIGQPAENDGVGEPVSDHVMPALAAASADVPQTSDEFDAPQLGLQWQWHANHRDDWLSLRARPGWLRLFAQANPNSRLNSIPHLLAQKFPARTFVVETKVELTAAHAGDEAGLAVVGREEAAIALVRDGAGGQVICRQNRKITRLATLDEHVVRLQLHVADDGLCRFAFARDDGRFISAPEPFAAQPGVWIGAKVGLYCSQTAAAGGHADFDYFRFSAAGPV